MKMRFSLCVQISCSIRNNAVFPMRAKIILLLYRSRTTNNQTEMMFSVLDILKAAPLFVGRRHTIPSYSVDISAVDVHRSRCYCASYYIRQGRRLVVK